MYTKKKKQICPVCGSENISEDLLMKCNCTKGMGRNLCYPKFKCRDCHAKFGDKKNDRAKDTVAVTFVVSPAFGPPVVRAATKGGSGAELTINDSYDEIRKIELTRKKWRDFVRHLYDDLHILEWSKESSSHMLDGESWSIEIKFACGESATIQGMNASPPHYDEFVKAIEGLGQ